MSLEDDHTVATPFEPHQYGQYLLTGEIGAGGMAQIFSAERIGAAGFSRELAIKCILPSLSADDHFVSRFIDEAKLVSRLVHPNIVQIFELGMVREQYYIAMELVRGRDVGDMLKRLAKTGQYMPVPIAAYIVLEMLRGLSYAHTLKDKEDNPLNIIHRDVSPSNVLVSFNGEVKVCDFGIAKATTMSGRTQTGVVKGKVRYLPPESFDVSNGPVDARADVFAAGLMLLELLTTRPAFQGDDPLQLINQIVNMKVTLPSSLRPEVPKCFDDIVARAAERSLKKRYDSAKTMLDALTEALFEQRMRVGPEEVGHYLTELFADEVARDTAHEKTREEALQHFREMVANNTTPTGRIVASAREGETGGLRTNGLGVEFSQQSSNRLGLWVSLVLLLGLVMGGGYWLTRPQLAEVQITSMPAGARISLNGRPSGLVTPAQVRDLERGVKYLLKLELDKYVLAERSFVLGAGEKRLVSVKLEPLEPVAASPPIPQKEPIAPVPPTKRKTTCRFGAVSVRVTGVPWAKVKLDGNRSLGETPILRYRVPAGKHTLVVSHPPSGKRKSVSIKVKGCGHAPLKVSL